MTSPTLEQFIEEEEWQGTEGRLPDGRFKATWDSIGGCWNIGPGLTQGITKTTVMTRNQIAEAFAKELVSFEEGVHKAVKVQVSNNEFTVLVSFAYNVGLGNFRSSTLLRVLNAGHSDQVPAQLKRWVHGHATGTTIIPGLVNRRNAEIKLWMTPDASWADTLAKSAVEVTGAIQPAAYVPHYDPAAPVPKGAVTLEMIMSELATLVNVPLSATTAIVSQLAHKVITATQGTLLASVVYLLAHFPDTWSLAGASSLSVYACTALIALIEWYKHSWVQNSNTTTTAIIDSLEKKLQSVASEHKN
jgi:lysozyme